MKHRDRPKYVAGIGEPPSRFPEGQNTQLSHSIPNSKALLQKATESIGVKGILIFLAPRLLGSLLGFLAFVLLFLAMSKLLDWI